MTLEPWPYFDTDQISAATDVLRSGKVNYWTGSETSSFEEEFSRWSNSQFSIALANGSLALSSAYLSLSLGTGDEIITTPRTFIATASSAVLLGIKPIFADVDPDSGAITPETIEPLITSRTKAISVVHLAGWPADMPGICDLAKSRGLSVIEDCSQAHGAQINGKSVGSFGDVATWSFCQDKIISTGGEGGMVTTSRSDIWNSIWSFKDHGKSHQAVFDRTHPPGFRWLHEQFGSNFRLTEYQSAIGRVQLRLLPNWTKLRTRNALFLAKALSHYPLVRIPLPPDNIVHAWYKFYVYIDQSLLSDGWSRDRIIYELSQLGFPAFSGTCSEIYQELCFKKYFSTPHPRLPVAQSLGQSSLMFLVHPTISLENISSYSEAICHVLAMASN